MGDPTAMTIEFLRARLLSERSVSRSARQRADQLAKRVLELEEQLRIVTIQRKKAEKAASEVLAILESQGVNDFSEVIDSSFDRDNIPGESKGSDENAKGDETSTASRMDRSDVEDGISGSEVDISPSQGGSLSWKSRNNSSLSSEKRKEYQARQRQRRDVIFRSGSSPQHLLGKSCRRIKSSWDMGSALENGSSKATQPEHASDCADDEALISKETNDIEQEKLVENIFHSSEDQNGGSIVDIYADEFGRDEAMEKALQQQAQLIVQYQAEENAQREWEEKYNENNSSTRASDEQHEKMINAGEDKEAPVEDTNLGENFLYKKETEMNNGNTDEQDPEIHSRKGEAATDSESPEVADITSSDMHPLSVDIGVSVDQRCHEAAANEYGVGPKGFDFPRPSTSHPETCEKQCPEILDSNAEVSSHSHSKLQLHGSEYHRNMWVERPASSRSSSKFSKGQWSSIQSQIHRDLPETPKTGLGNVLEALQHAKLSLRQELTRLQQQRPMSPPRSAWATMTDSQSLATRSTDTLGIPFGSAGLLRLPFEVTPQVDLPRSSYYDTGLSMSNLRSYAGFSEGYTTDTCNEIGTAVTSARRRYHDPVPTRASMPTQVRRHSDGVPDLAARTPSYDGIPNTSYVSVTRGMSAVDAYSVYTSADLSRLGTFGMQRPY